MTSNRSEVEVGEEAMKYKKKHIIDGVIDPKKGCYVRILTSGGDLEEVLKTFCERARFVAAHTEAQLLKIHKKNPKLISGVRDVRDGDRSLISVSIRDTGRALLWRGYNVLVFMENELWDKDREIGLLAGWFDVNQVLPPVDRIELYDTCVLVVLDNRVVMLTRVSDGPKAFLKEKPL